MKFNVIKGKTLRVLLLAQLLLGCSRVNMSNFSVKTSFSKQQLEYGSRHGYDQIILAINQEDATKGEYISSMDLRRAIDFLQKKVDT